MVSGAAVHVAALRLLGRLWLEEVTGASRPELDALPELAVHLPPADDRLTDLAAEFHRLFIRQAPPYESVYVDPSAMLDAPATARVAALYNRAGWSPPGWARYGAVDHVGLELLALADCLAAGAEGAAQELLIRHLALWVPPLVVAVASAAPHPFYAEVAALSSELVLSLLPDDVGADEDPFPALPPAPAYRASDEAGEGRGEPSEADPGLRAVVRRLLTPREAGLYLTPDAIAAIGRGAGLPVGAGDRFAMLEGLLRLSGSYGAAPALAAGLADTVAARDEAYASLAAAWPAWSTYGGAWRARLRATGALAAELAAIAPPG